ncbi:hypothetical protein QQF64_006237 [Cirrhinus molitorella]|uniref:Uncharacterized protein n=1 Tax=Cirrhinus molitorella TaxID=172907 RepID=A0ABR3MEH2_9TELE
MSNRDSSSLRCWFLILHRTEVLKSQDFYYEKGLFGGRQTAASEWSRSSCCCRGPAAQRIRLTQSLMTVKRVKTLPYP